MPRGHSPIPSGRAGKHRHRVVPSAIARRLRRGKHTARSLTALGVVAALSVSGATALSLVGDGSPARAATSPSQQWITSVGASATGVGTSTTFKFGTTGVTGTVNVTAGYDPGGYWPGSAGASLATFQDVYV